MKKLLCLILAVLLLMVAGCGEAKDEKSEQRFSPIEVGFVYGKVYVIRDNETGVLYLGRTEGGWCVVVNPDGTPYIDKEAKP